MPRQRRSSPAPQPRPADGRASAAWPAVRAGERAPWLLTVSLHAQSPIAAIVIPFAAFLLAAVMLWGPARGVDRRGRPGRGVRGHLPGDHGRLHRLLTHRSFQTYPAVATPSPCSARCRRGLVIKWVADHRKHHDFADEDGTHQPSRRGPRSTRRVERPVARPHRMAVQLGRPGRPAPLRRGSAQGPWHAADRRRREASDPGQPGDPVPRWATSSRGPSLARC